MAENTPAGSPATHASSTLSPPTWATPQPEAGPAASTPPTTLAAAAAPPPAAEGGEEEEDEEEEEELELPRFPGNPPTTGPLTALRALPVRRTVEWRAGRTWVCADRGSNHEAAVGFCVGEVAAPRCDRCVNGLGPFASCVVVSGFLSGACTNCHWGSGGKTCDFHRKYLRRLPDSLRTRIFFWESVTNFLICREQR